MSSQTWWTLTTTSGQHWRTFCCSDVSGLIDDTLFVVVCLFRTVASLTSVNRTSRSRKGSPSRCLSSYTWWSFTTSRQWLYSFAARTLRDFLMISYCGVNEGFFVCLFIVMVMIVVNRMMCLCPAMHGPDDVTIVMVMVNRIMLLFALLRGLCDLALTV